MEDLLCWWITQQETEVAVSMYAENNLLPPYIEEELLSRSGRSGRQRLWFHHSLNYKPFENVMTEAFNQPHVYISQDAGGIIFLSKDLNSLKNAPGLITNLKLIPKD